MQNAMPAVLPKILLSLVVVYFVYHVFSGNSGIITAMQLEKQANTLAHELDIISEKRTRLENKVNRFYDTSLDKDLLDEQARRTLGYVGQNEIVIYWD